MFFLAPVYIRGGTEQELVKSCLLTWSIDGADMGKRDNRIVSNGDLRVSFAVSPVFLYSN